MAKAGILEVADVFVVNKADRDGAAQVVRDLRQMLHLGAARAWDPPVLQTVATEGGGVEEVRAAIAEHAGWLTSSGERERKRTARLRREVEVLAAERFRVRAAAALDREPTLLGELVAGAIDPYRAAARLADAVGEGP
jgi:LAO/AO transport system kinase